MPISTDPVCVCPVCSTPLERQTSDHGVFWSCPRCGGRAVGLGLLKRMRDAALITRLWVAAEDGAAPHGRLCPVCGGRMRQVTLPDEQIPTVDVCIVCELVWFDPNKYEKLPAPLPPAEPALPEEGRRLLAQAVAIQQVTRMADERRREAQGEPPEEWWKIVASIFGVPVKEDEVMLQRPPWATWTLAALAFLVTSAASSHLDHWVQVFGLIPAQASRYSGLTFLTSFFLHSGLFHLATNVYFLLIFGDYAEDDLGIGRYLLLVFLAAAAGGAAHVAWEPRHDIPVIGASAGIAGIIAFYACRFPRTRLKFFIGHYPGDLYFRWATIPVWVFFVFWILTQAVVLEYQLAGISAVSAAGHLGGAAVGVLFFLEWRFVARGIRSV